MAALTPDAVLTSRWTAMPLPRDVSSGRLYVVTDEFGTRDGKHHGIDLATRARFNRPTTGLPVYAVSPGVITRIVNDERGGLMSVLETVDGQEVKYAHLETTTKPVGTVVLPGEQIATSGKSGKVTGPHLHLEVHENGQPVDPLPFLEEAAAHVDQHGQPKGASSLLPVLLFGGLGLAGLAMLLTRGK